MRRALELAERGRGATAPNPCVGAVLVEDDRVAAEGWHSFFGGPHAEVEAIADARKNGVDPSRCTLVVTLEPCNHQGKTPPCTRAILDAGISKVVVGVSDPNSVAGGGADFLRSQGVEVEVGCLAEECEETIREFVHLQRTDRAFVILKLAATLDGRIATRSRRPEAVSGPESHERVQSLRATVQAVMVGGTTFRSDNPRLTVRKTGYGGSQPWAVVVTGNLPENPDRFFLTRERPGATIFWTREDVAECARARVLESAGCRVWADSPGCSGLAGLMTRLRRDVGAYRVLCEGGGGLAGSLADQGLVDELWYFLAMKILGDDGAVAAFSGRTALGLDQAVGFCRTRLETLGDDLLIRLSPVNGNRPCLRA
ncbi:MAG: bifunctional diaminohydroxyphosphoribosylaminopyrimidine deaminase/5-amino-6-(5-phosphoribosylamino)uracil reductase RibD [Deltaproteobacteria bacterium]|nr:bifunctional diaminohydroxyphosphoribosylaminopyrimidine deaminase/5-amino-6-(5-phosphoribosylamino)uracil reductase RibD [Deltaproteobacteria bacterium]